MCRDFQRGNCRFGARCKYLHTLQRQPQAPEQQQRGFAGTAFNQPPQTGGLFSSNSRLQRE